MISQVMIEDRPYEKFAKYGLDALTDKDLVAILLRTGTKAYNVQQLAAYLLTYGKAEDKKKERVSLLNLYQYSYEELQQIKGIGKVKALQIMTVLELSRRISKEKNSLFGKCTTPSEVASFFMEELRHQREEHFITAFLDAKCRMIGYQLVSKGSLTASIVHPREVFKAAIQHSSHRIILLHNHPSGDPSPSHEDIEITKRLQHVGEIIGIPVLDHIIIGDGIYNSLHEESYI